VNAPGSYLRTSSPTCLTLGRRVCVCALARVCVIVREHALTDTHFHSLLPANLLQPQGAGDVYHRHDPITPQAASDSTPDTSSLPLPSPGPPHCEIESWLLLLKNGGCYDYELPSSSFPSLIRLVLDPVSSVSVCVACALALALACFHPLAPSRMHSLPTSNVSSLSPQGSNTVSPLLKILISFVRRPTAANPSPLGRSLPAPPPS